MLVSPLFSAIPSETVSSVIQFITNPKELKRLYMTSKALEVLFDHAVKEVVNAEIPLRVYFGDHSSALEFVVHQRTNAANLKGFKFMTDADLQKLSTSHNCLRSLTLSLKGFKNLPQTFNYLTHLRSLDLGDCMDLVATAIKNISALKSLEKFRLKNLQFTNELEVIQSMITLSELSFGKLQSHNNRFLFQIQSLTRLKRLELNWKGTFKDLDLELLTRLTCLVKFKIDGCMNLTEQDMGYLAALPNLRALSLCSCFPESKDVYAYLRFFTTLN